MATKAEYTPVLRLRNFTPSIYLTETSTCVHQKKCVGMVTLALPITVPNYKLLKCPSKRELKKNCWSIHVTEYCIAMDMNGPQIH